MNLSTQCNCCMKEDVCKHKEEYQLAVESILSSFWDDRNGEISELKDSDIVSVTIRCAKFAGQTMRGNAP